MMFTIDWSKIHWLKDVFVWKLNGRMWSTANRLNDCVSSCHQVSVLENINTFVYFLKLFESHWISYYLSNCQIMYMTTFLQSVRRCRLFTSALSYPYLHPFFWLVFGWFLLLFLCFCFWGQHTTKVESSHMNLFSICYNIKQFHHKYSDQMKQRVISLDYFCHFPPLLLEAVNQFYRSDLDDLKVSYVW